MADTLTEDLRRLIAAKQVLVVVGTGVAIAATSSANVPKGAPASSWPGLLKLGVQECRKLFPGKLDAAWQDRVLGEIGSGDLDDMVSAAEKISKKLGGNDGPEFKRWLRETVGQLKASDATVLERLAALDVPLATTNYDDLLATATGRRAVTWQDPDDVAGVLRGDSDGILHLHGHWQTPASVVLGIRSYEDVRQDTHAQAVVRALAMTKSLVFVGCGEGLSDPNFKPFLSWLGAVSRHHTARHYRLCLEAEVGALHAAHPPEQRIFPVSYGKKHADLAGFLAGLAPRPAETETSVTVVVGAKGSAAKGKSGGKGTASPPRHSAAIGEYLKRLRKATAKLQLVGIGKGIPIEFPIEQAYVPLNVMARMDVTGGRRKPGALSQGAGRAGCPQPAADRLDGTDAERRGEDTAPYRPLAPEADFGEGPFGDGNIELAEIFGYATKREHSGVILLGDPGAGKTTGARQFCWRVLNAAATAVPGLPSDVLPVFLRLRDLRREHATLNDFIRHALAAPNAGRAELANPADDLLARERVLWVFDGLDEVVDEAARVRVCGWIRQALADRPEDFYLVTSRYQGYQGKVNLGPSFCQFQVEPLTEPQVREFVEHWYGAVFRRLHGEGAEVAEKAAAEIKSLLDILAQPDYRIGRLRELPANPLMLTILCVVHHENHNLPRRRADLYARCVRVLVEHWRQAVREAAGIAPFEPKAAESVLGSVAWWLHGTENRTTETVAALGAEATKALVDIAASAGLGRDGTVFIERMRDESGILAPYGDGQTGFLHLTFQEYLAGAHAAQEGRVAKLAETFGRSWWREATLMAVALGSKAFAQEFFTAVLKAGALGAQRELVEQCLEEAQHVTLEPFVAELRGTKHAARRVEILRLLSRHNQPDLLAVCRELAGTKDKEVVALAREILQRATGAAQPRAVARGKGFVDARTGMAFVWIPAGEFEMGQAKSDFDNERPVHWVMISKGFWLAKYAVTNAEYQKYLEANPQAEKPREWNNSQFNDPLQPVVGVSWYDAQAFCAWAGYRLPTEAEWEYACRAGTTTQFSFGDDEALLKDYGWYDKNSGGRTHAVGQKKPNPWGLYDMHGNVWEWCQDSPRTYEAKAVIDPVGPENGWARVLRGGSWISSGRRARAAIRYGNAPDRGNNRIGFRPCPSSISPAGEAGGRKSSAERGKE